jgi:phospholipase/carboxylesterase
MPAEITHVAWSTDESSRAGTPLVVALHGRGSVESTMVGLASYLPAGFTVAALRAPIEEGGGYAWFANRGIGRPIEESIKDTAGAVFEWLDDVREQHSHVFLLGFSGGTAMGGGLLLLDSAGFAGAALMSGTLPWDAGFNTADNVLSGVPVFWANDEADPVIPRDLVGRSEEWLRTSSGATLTERHYPGLGHSISREELADVSAFLSAVVVD